MTFILPVVSEINLILDSISVNMTTVKIAEYGVLKIPIFSKSNCYSHWKLEYGLEFHVRT